MVAACLFVPAWLGCGRTALTRDGASPDGISRDGSSLRDSSHGLPSSDAIPDAARDNAGISLADSSVAMPDHDSGAEAPEAAKDAGEDCCDVGAAACTSYVVTGPPVALPSAATPSVRLGNKYAVLSTVNAQADLFDTNVRHYWHDVNFSWLDPKAGVFSDQVTSFRYRGNTDAGVPVDYGTASPVAIAAAANGYAVVWRVYRQSAFSLWFALLDSAGAGASEPIMLDSNTQGPCDLAWDGTHFAAVWTASQGVLRFAQFNSQGILVFTTEVVPRTWLGPARLFWDGSGYGVFWENLLPNLDEVWFARLDTSGSPLVAPVQLTSPDNYGGGLMVEPIDEGYIAFWIESPKTGGGTVQVALHKLDQNGQPLAPARSLASQGCGVAALARSGAEFGAICSDNDAVGFAGLGRYESTSISPVLSIGLPVPTRDGIRVATATALRGHDDLFDIFWTGSVDGVTWGDQYFSQVRCAP